MFVYLLNILSICLYGLIFLKDGLVFRKGEQSELRRIFFLVLCFVQCMIISCARYDIGTDYRWYAYGFRDMAESGFSELTYGDWEIGFVLLNKAVGLFTKEPAVFIGICSAISLSGTFYLIWRYSKNPFMSVFLFLNTYLFYLDMNFIRQSIAMSIMCFAYGFLQDRKIWRYLLLCAAAAAFHLTALYMAPVLFITFIKLNLKTLPIYAGAVVLYFALSDMALKFVLSVIYKEYEGTRFINAGIAWYYAVYPVLICVGIAALAFYLKFDIPRHFNVLMHLMLLMGFWQIVMTKHSIFERFSYYTMSFIVIAVPEAIVLFKDKFLENSRRSIDDSEGLDAAVEKAEKRLSVIVPAISSAVLVLAFVYNMLGLILPENGAHGVLPYRNLAGFNIPNIDSWFKR